MKIQYEENDYTSRFMALMEYDIVCISCRNKLPNMQPDDIAQELRFRLFTQIGKYNKDKASFRTWAITVLRNHLINLNTSLNRDKRKINSNTMPLVDELDD